MLRDDSGNGGGRPSSPRNVLGDRLDVCSMEPKTGFFRDGCCNTNGEDVGSHTVCVVMTAEFLEFSNSRGNDLSTPMPQFGFSGLRPRDRWCLCAPRWREALEAGCAPRVVLRATHEGALDHGRSPISSVRPGPRLSSTIAPGARTPIEAQEGMNLGRVVEPSAAGSTAICRRLASTSLQSEPTVSN